MDPQMDTFELEKVQFIIPLYKGPKNANFLKIGIFLRKS